MAACSCSKRGRISIATRDAVIAERLDEVADAAAAMLQARKEKEQAARSGFAELRDDAVARAAEGGAALMTRPRR